MQSFVICIAQDVCKFLMFTNNLLFNVPQIWTLEFAT